MPPRFTRTSVVYFNHDDLEPLRDEIGRLYDNFRERAPHLTGDAGEVCRRFEILRIGVDLLAEPVPAAYGG